MATRYGAELKSRRSFAEMSATGYLPSMPTTEIKGETVTAVAGIRRSLSVGTMKARGWR